MTDTELDALEAAAKAATPGPWNTKEGPDFSEIFAHDKNIALIGSQHADAAYIAAANPAAVLELIAELRQTRAERDFILEQVDELFDADDLLQAAKEAANVRSKV